MRAEKRSVEPREEAPPSMAGSTEVEGNEADNCSEPPASESKPKSKAKTRADGGSGKVVSQLQLEMTPFKKDSVAVFKKTEMICIAHWESCKVEAC